MEKDIHRLTVLLGASRGDIRRCLAQVARQYKMDPSQILEIVLSQVEIPHKSPDIEKMPRKDLLHKARERGIALTIERIQGAESDYEAFKHARDMMGIATNPLYYDKEFLWRVYNTITEQGIDLHINMARILFEKDEPLSEVLEVLLSDPPTEAETYHLFRLGYNAKKGIVKVTDSARKVRKIVDILLEKGTKADKEATVEHLLN